MPLSPLSPTTQKFVLHWGEMGSRWGVNRTVAQIHALVFCSPSPVNAEEIADTLEVARSNVSNSLKELQAWGLLRVVHLPADRRDHFVAHQDIWEIFRVVMDERKKRELDPTLQVLRECAAESAQDGALDASTRQKMEGMLEFMEIFMRAYDDFKQLPTPTLKRLLKAGGSIAQFLGPDKKAAKR
ncbi:MarR family transcriptional regulator [Pelomonas sp. V22]|uniref:GbsR/MarR family transcriptional regulator n=1 Tax=Pelomonas sp. V22 TaxID=2822139 RepID=UPI0024A8EB3C|nr:MarR family transcriptional regulator [Pelomonas sp. V22]